MSIALVQKASAQTVVSTDTTITCNISATAQGNDVFALVLMRSNNNCTSVTDSAGSFYPCRAYNLQVTGTRAYIWSLRNCPAGLTSVTATMDSTVGGAGAYVLIVMEYSGVVSLGQFITDSSGSASSLNDSVGLQNTGNWALAAIILTNTSTTYTATGGTKEVDVLASNNTMRAVASDNGPNNSTIAGTFGTSCGFAMVYLELSVIPISFNMRAKNGVTSGHIINVSLPFRPAKDTLVVIGLAAAFNLFSSLVSIKDTANNVYTVTQHSPSSTHDATAGSVWIAYLIAPANADNIITADFGAATISFCEAYAETFNCSAAWSFDKDAAGSGTGTNVNSPGITPAAAGELLFAIAAPENVLTSANSPWTQSQVGTTMGCVTEYILNSASGNTNVAYTQNNSVDWDAMAAAFISSAGAGDVVTITMGLKLA